MTKRDFPNEMTEKVKETSLDDSIDRANPEELPAVFHRVTCPECGEDNLSLFDFGVFLRSDFLGMTGEGKKGCGHVELDGDYEYVVECRSCGHRVFDDPSCTEEELMQWASEAGEDKRILPFHCSVCDSTSLSEIRTGVEIVRDVVAVCEVSQDDGPEEQPLVALVPDKEIWVHGPIRYRCARGHELAKDDGTPVESAEELVAWLNARSTGDPVDR